MAKKKPQEETVDQEITTEPSQAGESAAGDDVVDALAKLQPPQVLEVPKSRPELETIALARGIQMGIGVDYLGATLAVKAQRGTTLAITQLGVLATSGKNGRQVLIPWPNIRGADLTGAVLPKK